MQFMNSAHRVGRHLNDPAPAMASWPEAKRDLPSTDEKLIVARAPSPPGAFVVVVVAEPVAELRPICEFGTVPDPRLGCRILDFSWCRYGFWAYV